LALALHVSGLGLGLLAFALTPLALLTSLVRSNVRILVYCFYVTPGDNHQTPGDPMAGSQSRDNVRRNFSQQTPAGPSQGTSNTTVDPRQRSMY